MPNVQQEAANLVWLQTTLTNPGPEARLTALLRDKRLNAVTARALLHSIDDGGYRLDYATYVPLARNRVMQRAIPQVWPLDSIFGEDATYSDTRFELVTRFMAETMRFGEDRVRYGKIARAALRQIMRVYDMGRANPHPLSVNRLIETLGGKTATKTLAMYITHNNFAYESTRFAHEHRAAWPTPEAEDPVVRRQGEALALAIPLRQQKFVMKWLPALVDTPTYQRIRHLPPTMLAALYPDLWTQGYEAYHAHIMGFSSSNPPIT